ncbi:hypothetical protein APHAL10511_006900 [Amanita phalloides]|nr:hypothetical protein APHAL10511_006900 [Amanita phalloides]
MVLKSEASPSLGPILRKLSRRYSPISKFNQRIYVHEEDNWVIKGRYNDAIADDEDVEWSIADGKFALFLCAEDERVLSVGTSATGSASTSQAHVGIPACLSSEEIISLLNIPLHLTDKEDTSLKSSSQWPARKKSNQQDLVDIFISHSMWHSHLKRMANVSNYPVMQAWMEGGENAPTDIEAWGYGKVNYTFVDLFRFFDEQEKKDGDKGKEKEHVDENEGTKKKKKKKKRVEKESAGSSKGKGQASAKGKKAKK